MRFITKISYCTAIIITITIRITTDVTVVFVAVVIIAVSFVDRKIRIITSTSVGIDLYPHMPILHNAHDDYPLAAEHARWPILLNLGFWRAKIPCLGRRRADLGLNPERHARKSKNGRLASLASRPLTIM